MASKYLDSNGLLYFWQKIKNLFVSDVTYDSTSRTIQKSKNGTASNVVTLSKVATSNSYSDLDNKPTIPPAVQPTTTTPKMDGTANVGSESKYARGDHVHPSDTSRVPTTRTINGKALSADISLDADDIGISDFTGSTSSAAGTHGLVPAPTSNSRTNLLFGDAKWRALQIVDANSQKVSGAYVLDNNFASLTMNDASSDHAGLLSASDKDKLDGIAAGAEANVNADWNASSGDAQILNKPTLGAAAAKGVVTSISGDSANLPTVTAVKNYVSTAVTGTAAYQGIAPTTFAPTDYEAGWYWIVGTAGTYVDQVCEAGDMIFCKTAAATFSASDFDVVQTNLDITNISNTDIDTIVAS
jgi:hypothetical protein